MKIDIRKITKESKRFSLDFINDFDNVVFFGSVVRLSCDILRLEANIKGNITITCDLSGEDFFMPLNENIYLLLKNGIWGSDDLKKYGSYDAIEIFDNYVDLDYILHSELESIKLDYHIKT